MIQSTANDSTKADIYRHLLRNTCIRIGSLEERYNSVVYFGCIKFQTACILGVCRQLFMSGSRIADECRVYRNLCIILHCVGCITIIWLRACQYQAFCTVEVVGIVFCKSRFVQYKSLCKMTQVQCRVAVSVFITGCKEQREYQCWQQHEFEYLFHN